MIFYVELDRNDDGRAVFEAETVKKFGRVIYEDGVTVLKVADRVFTARAEAGEAYDAEKGLLICLMKAMGMSVSDMLKLKNSAIVKKSKKSSKVIKEDKRKSKKV